MTIPAHARTWQFKVNQFYEHPGTYQAACKELLWGIKEALKGAGAWTDAAGAPRAATGAWVVKSSCDGSGGPGSFGNGDGVDRWVAPANLIPGNPAANHSWIVLEQAGIPGSVGNLQLCIDLRYANAEYSADIVISVSAGFAGGTATARPIAADEKVLNAVVGPQATTTRWGGTSGTTNHTILHVLMTADGTATRVIMTRTSNNNTGPHTCGYWAFELPIAIAAWTNPSACVAQAVDSTTPSYNIDESYMFGQTALTWGRTPGGTNFEMSWMSLGDTSRGEWARSWGDLYTSSCMNDNDTMPMMSVALISETVNARGKNGRLVDIYQAPYIHNFNSTQGHTMPGTGTLRQWCRFGEYYQPWNGTIPMAVA